MPRLKNLALAYEHRPKLPTAEVRRRSPWNRLTAVETIRNVIIAMPEFHMAAVRLSKLIREPYRSRHPLTATEEKRRNAIANQRIDEPLVLPPSWKSQACGYTFLSSTGTGKTTFLNAFLSRIPQVIRHTQYGDDSLAIMQIVYVKISVPPDGSLKAFCLSFFQEIDRRLGMNYAKQALGAGSVAGMTLLMGKVATLVSLGTLFVDEFQNLKSAKSENGEKVLNLFVALIEDYGVSVVVLTTPAAMLLLEKKTRDTRKLMQHGFTAFRNMAAKSEDWVTFTDDIWNYTYTKTKPQLTQKIRESWHRASGGNPAFAALAFKFAQEHAIAEEAFSTGIVDDVSFVMVLNTDMAPLKPAIDALRSKSTKRIAEFDDLLSAPDCVALSKLIVSDIANSAEQMSQVVPAVEEDFPEFSETKGGARTERKRKENTGAKQPLPDLPRRNAKKDL